MRTRTNRDPRKEGMRQSLGRFKTERLSAHAEAYQVTAYDHETGEVRKYQTYYEQNIAFISNTDFLYNDKHKTTYVIEHIPSKNSYEQQPFIMEIVTAEKGHEAHRHNLTTQEQDEEPNWKKIEKEIEDANLSELMEVERPTDEQRRADLNNIFGSYTDALMGE